VVGVGLSPRKQSYRICDRTLRRSGVFQPHSCMETRTERLNAQNLSPQRSSCHKPALRELRYHRPAASACCSSLYGGRQCTDWNKSRVGQHQVRPHSSLPVFRVQVQKQANAMSIPHDDPRTHLSDIEARLTRFEQWVSAASALGFVFALSSYGMLGTL
jgi:hypothetical protein